MLQTALVHSGVDGVDVVVIRPNVHRGAVAAHRRAGGHMVAGWEAPALGAVYRVDGAEVLVIRPNVHRGAVAAHRWAGPHLVAGWEAPALGQGPGVALPDVSPKANVAGGLSMQTPSISSAAW